MSARATVALAFAVTMTLAGFLLFQVQLVLGKFILPRRRNLRGDQHGCGKLQAQHDEASR